MKVGDILEPSENYIYQKKKLRQEGLLEIPMAVDSSRYFIGTFRLMDIVYTIPFLIVSIIIIYFLNDTGNLNSSTAVFAFTPPVLALTVLWIKHPDRKNISLVNTMYQRVKFARSKKLYELTKERAEDVQNDIRSQLGIFNIANDCFETLENTLVKVVEVSSVNLTGMSDNDRNKTLSAYQAFLNDYPLDAFPLQMHQFSKPINLKSYLQFVHEKADKEKNYVKRMLNESYINKTNEIQKSKKMVSKARYIMISEKIGSDKEKAIQKVSTKAETMVSGIENMLSEKHKLNAHVLNNEELFDLIYSSIDYENAQIKQGMRKSSFQSPITVGQKTFEEMQRSWQEENEFKIN